MVCQLYNALHLTITMGESEDGTSAGALYLLTPGITEHEDLGIMERHQLHRFDDESRRTLRRGFSHFLSPQLQVLIKEKPRIALSEKADFAELLSEGRSGRRIEELSMELMRQSFKMRKRVAKAPGTVDNAEEEGGPPVPPDVPLAHQTTNKFSPAFAKKQAKQAVKQAAKRPRPTSDDEEGQMASASALSSASATPLSADIKPVVKPLIAKLMAMKWADWRNPFAKILNRNNAPPRYFEFITRPMNLTFIRDKLNKNKYTTVTEIEADLELIVNNALTFNRPEDPVYQFALELQAAFRSELPLIKQTLDDLAQQGGGGSGSGGVQDKKQRIR